MNYKSKEGNTIYTEIWVTSLYSISSFWYFVKYPSVI